MFTGIIESLGKIEKTAGVPGGTRVRIGCRDLAGGLALGDSIAIDGVCLTVTAIDASVLRFDAIPETLKKTRLGRVGKGDAVNLERAMSAGGRFDGHLVQGHVDGVGRVRRFDRKDNEVELHVECEGEIATQLVSKGSVTIDGVSLTVVDVARDGFHVALIPHTLEVTTLANLAVGDPLNLEVDVFGKYVKQYLDRVLPDLVAGAQSARDDESG